MAKTSIVIRMGAAHWDAQVSPEPGNTMHFDIRSMTRDQKREFFQSFRDGYRAATHSSGRRHKAKQGRR